MESTMKGAMTALITPFSEGKVDYLSLESLIEAQIEAGMDGIVPCGTTGESPTLTHAEHKEIIEFTVKKAKGRLKVLAGTGSNATSEAIALSRHAEKAGAHGVLLVAPYYNKPTQQGLYLHYQAIAESIGIDCTLYNIPSRTSLTIELETLMRLAEIKNITAVKDAVGDIDFTSQTIDRLGKAFAVLSGNDSLNYPILSLGGCGVISVASNLLPKEIKAMYALSQEGKWAEAREIHFRLWELFERLFWETNPIPVKTAAHAMKKISSAALRLPLSRMSEEKWLGLKKSLQRLGLL